VYTCETTGRARYCRAGGARPSNHSPGARPNPVAPAKTRAYIHSCAIHRYTHMQSLTSLEREARTRTPAAGRVQRNAGEPMSKQDSGADAVTQSAELAGTPATPWRGALQPARAQAGARAPAAARAARCGRTRLSHLHERGADMNFEDTIRAQWLMNTSNCD
jgi:hypothetical protein